MESFFESIKIRRLLLAYVSIVVFFCVISEVPIIKSWKPWNESLFLLLCNLGVIVWFIFKLRRSQRNMKEELISLRSSLKKSDIAFSILINITFTIGFLIAVIYAVIYLWPAGGKELLKGLNETDISTLYEIIVNAIAATFIAPVAEEFIFRGIILNRLKIKIGVKKAIIISSILFGLIHYELGIVSAVIFGICMSLIYLKTKNIFVTSSIHIINNFIVSAVQVISFLMSKGAAQQSITANDFSWYLLLIGILSLIASILMFLYFMKKNWRHVYNYEFRDV